MWQIGSYQLDPASFVLSREGEPIGLQPRPLDLLVYLIARHHQLVARDELFAEVWGGIAVSDGALSTAVYEIRAALGDHERDRGERWVETVRGGGIRFQGPVEEITLAAPADRVPFVGRDSIAAELHADVKRAANGNGGIHMIEGTAGIGKTRLVQEVTGRLSSVAVLNVFCEPGGPPFWPWIQLANALSETGREATRRPSWLTDRAVADDPRSQQVERMLDILMKAAAQRPIVIVIEDLHWADGSSVELLKSLAPRMSACPIQIFVTLRSEDNESSSAREVRDSPDVKWDRLEPLMIMDLYALVEAIMARTPSPELVDWIRENSGGIPLMARELAEQVTVVGEPPAGARQLARRLFSGRFEGLNEETRTVLGVAALCGERFDVSLIEAAAEDFLLRGRSWIQQGLTAGVLVPIPRQPLRFAFRHALLRDAARGQLADGEAAKWHGRLATVIERQHPKLRREALFRLARHTAEAAIADENLERPLRYALLAAGRAIDSSAWEEVRVNSEHVLDWIEFSPPGRHRDAQEIEAGLLRAAGIATYSGHVEETDSLLSRIEPLIERVGDEQARCLVSGFYFANARNLGDFATAHACADAVCRQEGLEQVAECWRVSLATLSGSFADATADPDWGEPLPEEHRFAEYAKRSGRDPGIDRLVFSSFAFWAVGRDQDALANAERAVQWTEAYADARGKVVALFMLCLLHEFRHDWTSLRERAVELDPYAERHGIVQWLGSGVGFGLWARAQQDEIHEMPGASILSDRGRAPDTCIGTALHLFASRIFRWNGDLASAETVAREALEYCRYTDERFVHAELHRQLGEIRKAVGDEPGAREQWRQAVDVARAQGHVVSEIRTLVSRRETRDRDRLNDLRARFGPGLGSYERGLLDSVLA